MPGPESSIDLSYITGHATGVQYGNTYQELQDGTIVKIASLTGDLYQNFNGSLPITLRQKAEEAHQKIKTAWKSAGTCGWLQNREEFSKWIEMKDQHSFLWIHGIKGCGKSTLMSRAIEHIREPSRDNVHLLFFYVSYGDAEPYKSMLRTFWEQAILQDDTRSTDRFANSTAREIQTELLQMLEMDKRHVYIVIDAVDQLAQGDQQELLGLLEALEVLNQEPKDTGNESRVAVLISSSNESGCFQLQANNLPCITVGKHDNDDDIQRFLEKEVVLSIPKSSKKDRLATLAIEKLKNNADGMFLLAKLQTASIRNMSSETEIEDALENLTPPDDLHKIYERYADGFQSRDKPQREQQAALRTMALLAHTTGSMSKEILFTALALKLDDGNLDQRFYKELNDRPQMLVPWCNSLIDINESLGVVQFCHGSIHLFFRDYRPAVNHRLIAQLCLAHLGSSDFARGPYPDVNWYNYGGLGPLLRDNPFLGFASCNWAPSVKKSVERNGKTSLEESHGQVLSCFRRLLRCEQNKSKQNLQLSFQIFFMTLGKLMPPGVHSEHIVSYFALHEFLEILIRKGWLDVKHVDSEGRTSMHWAIRNDVQEFKRNNIQDDWDHQASEEKSETVTFVEKLIDRGEDINAQDKAGRTPLYYASYYGKLDLVRLLLDRGALINRKSQENETPLIVACRGHHERIVQELLKRGADVEVESSLGTALQAVSCIGCCSCAERILRQYKDQKVPVVESKGPFGTSLHAAAYFGHADLVQCLLDERREKKGAKGGKKKFNVHETSKTYGSVLTAAAVGCGMGEDPARFARIFETFIEHGVNVNDDSGAFGPALHEAALNGQMSLVELLYKKGAKATGGDRGTAYEAAEMGNHEKVMEFLKENYKGIENYGKSKNRNKEIAFSKGLRKLFEHAVLSNNMKLSEIVIERAVKAFNAAIRKKHIRTLKAMTLVCKEVFNYVVDMATKKSEERTRPKEQGQAEDKKKETVQDESSSKIKAQEAPQGSGVQKQTPKIDKSAADTKESLRGERASKEQMPRGLPVPRFLFRRTGSASGPISDQIPSQLEENIERRPSVPEANQVKIRSPSILDTAKSSAEQPNRVDSFMPTPRSSTFEAEPLRRQSTSGCNNLEIHYREILDQLTQAAVKILEDAISKHTNAKPESLDMAYFVVELIARSWVEALNSLISMPDFGEDMLKMVVDERAKELRAHLKVQGVEEKDQEVEKKKGYEKAEALARVGVELLMTSVIRGPPYKRLSYVLSKLWVSAVNGVEALGEQGENGPVWTLIRLFAGRFSNAVKSGDKGIARTYAQGGFLLLRGAALSQKKSLMEKFVEEWVRQWKQAIECGMGGMIQQVADNGLKEYKSFLESGKHEEALGLLVGGMGLLRSAINQGIGEVVYPCLHQIISGFKLTMEHYCSKTSTEEQKDEPNKSSGNHSQGKTDGMDLSDIAEALILLIDTAERRDPDRLERLSPMILDLFEMVPEETQRASATLAERTICMTKKEYSGRECECEQRLAQMATAITCLLNLELSFSNPRPKISSALGKLAALMPWITKRKEFGRYSKATEFLKPRTSQGNVKSPVEVEVNHGEGEQVPKDTKVELGEENRTQDKTKTKRRKRRNRNENKKKNKKNNRNKAQKISTEGDKDETKVLVGVEPRQDNGMAQGELSQGHCKKIAKGKVGQEQDNRKARGKKNRHDKEGQEQIKKETQGGAEYRQDEKETQGKVEKAKDDKEGQSGANQECKETETLSRAEQGYDKKETQNGVKQELDETEMQREVKQGQDEKDTLSEAKQEWNETESLSGAEQEQDKKEMQGGTEQEQNKNERRDGAEHEQNNTKGEVGADLKQEETEAHEGGEQKKEQGEETAQTEVGQGTKAPNDKDKMEGQSGVEHDQGEEDAQGEVDQKTQRRQERDENSNFCCASAEFSDYFGVFSFFDGWSDVMADSSRAAANVQITEEAEQERVETEKEGERQPANRFLKPLDETTDKGECRPSNIFLRLV